MGWILLAICGYVASFVVIYLMVRTTLERIGGWMLGDQTRVLGLSAAGALTGPLGVFIVFVVCVCHW